MKSAPRTGRVGRILKLGVPIDVGERLKAGTKLRSVVGTVTRELEDRIQELLDAIVPGRLLHC